MRAYEDSLQRLGINFIDMLLVHDLDFKHNLNEEKFSYYFNQLKSSGYKALEDLKSSGQIKAIGIGCNEDKLIKRYLDCLDPDFFLVAMPYTLLAQNVLDEEFHILEKRGGSVVIGSPYASGI